MLYVFKCERITEHNRFPSSPASAKPAEMMINPGTLNLPHCSTTDGTDGAGMHITARSIGSGHEDMLGYDV